MFGLTEQEMFLYRSLVQDYAVRDITPSVVGNAKFITPIIEKNGEGTPDRVYVNQLVTDIETIITLVATYMAHDYAHFQDQIEVDETEVIKELYEKYETVLFNQFIRYGITFTQDVFGEILGAVILELPYLYMAVIEDEDFDEDSFLEEKMEAYEKYIEDNFSEEEGEED